MGDPNSSGNTVSIRGEIKAKGNVDPSPPCELNAHEDLGPGVGLIEIPCTLELLRGNPVPGIGVEGENATILDPEFFLRIGIPNVIADQSPGN